MKSFLKEVVDSLLEGGAVGHLMHLYDNRDMTFSEMKQILSRAASGKLEKTTEKLDGLNLVFTWDLTLGGLRVARGAGDIKRGGMDAASLAAKFEGRGNLAEAFNSAYKVLNGAVGSLPAKSQRQIFGQAGNKWYSVEVVYTENPNVINYDANTLVFHGWPVLELQKDGTVGTADDSSGADALSSQVDRMQNAVGARGWRLRGPALVRLKKLSDKSVLEGAFAAIDEALATAGLGDGATMRDYLYARLEDDARQQSLPDDVIEDVVLRSLDEEGAPSLVDIKKKSDKSLHGSITSFVRSSPELLKTYVRPIELAVNDFAVEVLKGFESTLVDDPEAEVSRIKDELKSAISSIEASGDEGSMAVLRSQMEKLKSAENISTPAEGVVFIWKGNAYKFTGNFSAVNQILGLFKYGRRGTKK